MSTELATRPAQPIAMGFDDGPSFEHLQRIAKVFSSSKMVPEHFQGEANFPNCIIALNMAARMRADPFTIFQALYIVHGKPGFSAQFVIAGINTSGRFNPLKFEMIGEGDDRQCIAWTTERGSLERLESPPVSIAMAKAEGWYGKTGSKWKTMPEVMLRYRAGTFFGRLYAPEMMMGMRTREELYDIDIESTVETPAASRFATTNLKQFDKPMFAPVETAAAVETGATCKESLQVPAKPTADLAPFMRLTAFILNDCKSTFEAMCAALAELKPEWLTVDPATWDGFESVPEEVCEKILKSKRGMQTALAAQSVGGGK